MAQTNATKTDKSSVCSLQITSSVCINVLLKKELSREQKIEKVTTRLRKGGLLSLFGCIGGYAALNFFSNQSLDASNDWNYTQKRKLFIDPMIAPANDYFDGNGIFDFRFDEGSNDDEEEEEKKKQKDNGD